MAINYELLNRGPLMLRHIVLWKFHPFAEGASREENLRAARERLLTLREEIPVLRSLEVGIDLLHSERSFDLALVALFDSKEDLAFYDAHPAHRAVVEFLRPLREKVIAVDHEY